MTNDNKTFNAKTSAPKLYHLYDISKEAMNALKGVVNKSPEVVKACASIEKAVQAQDTIKEALIEAMKMWDDYEEFYIAMGDIIVEMEGGIIKPSSLKQHHARIEKMRKLFDSKKELFTTFEDS